MTNKRNLKALARAHAARRGISYTAALREITHGSIQGSVSQHVYRPPTDAELVEDAVGGVLERLAEDDLSSHGLGMPAGGPSLVDPIVDSVELLAWSFQYDVVDEYDSGTLANGSMWAEVVVQGDLDEAHALQLESAGVVKRLWPGADPDDNGRVPVVLASPLTVQAEVAVLFDAPTQSVDVQEVLSVTWVDLDGA